jgi:hypothetical protein
MKKVTKKATKTAKAKKVTKISQSILKKAHAKYEAMPLLTNIAKMEHLAKLELLTDASGSGLSRRCVPSSSSTHHREAIRTSI